MTFCALGVGSLHSDNFVSVNGYSALGICLKLVVMSFTEFGCHIHFDSTLNQSRIVGSF